MRQHMGAEFFIEFLMRAFDEEIIVRRAEHRREGVRIGEGPCGGAVRPAQAIGRASFERRQPFEEAFRMDAFELRNRLAIRRESLHPRGARHESTDNKTRRRLMQTQHGEGIAMARADDCIDVVGRGAPIHQSESFRVNPLPLGEGGLRSKPGEGLHSCNSMRAANGWRGKASATNPSPDPASRGHPLPMGEGGAHHTGTFQISSAYSRIVRSEENHATRAVLRMLERRHAF